MGIIRDAAYKAAKDILVLLGINAVITAKELHDQKKEKRISNRFKLFSLLSKYKNHLLAICHEKKGSERTYVFSTIDDRIAFFASCPKKHLGIQLYDYDENVIGSVIFDSPVKTGLLINKKYSRKLFLNLGNSQVGTVELATEGRRKIISIQSIFWNLCLDNGDSTVEYEKEFKISPVDLFTKRAYQIGFNDEGKELVLVLIFIAVNEAKCILKEIK